MAENFVQAIKQQLDAGNLPTHFTSADLRRVMVPLGYSPNTCQVFPRKHLQGSGNTPHFAKVGTDDQGRTVFQLLSGGAAVR